MCHFCLHLLSMTTVSNLWVKLYELKLKSKIKFTDQLMEKRIKIPVELELDLTQMKKKMYVILICNIT